jgi:hypothetical protein
MPLKQTSRNIKQVPAVEEDKAEAYFKAPTMAPAMPKQRNNPYLLWIAGVLVVLAASASVFYYVQARKLTRQVADLKSQVKSATVTLPEKVSGENNDLITQVGKLVVLPKDEQPTIATVTDLEKLKNQPFFENAQVGDKVLIYANAKKAVLYRPSENKIIELAPLNLSSGQSSSSAAASGQKLKVEIRNASGTTGAANLFKAKLSSNEFTVAKVGNARAVYPKTMLYVPSSNKSPQLVNSLKQIASAEIVSSLPAGESASSADVVLFLGQQ